jgi:hypothetical protein
VAAHHGKGADLRGALLIFAPLRGVFNAPLSPEEAEWFGM